MTRTHTNRERRTVDRGTGDALVLARGVPPLGYLALREADRGPRPPVDEGEAADAAAGGFKVRLDPASGALQSLQGPDGKERVKTSSWSGLNQLVYAKGGEHSALRTYWDRKELATAPRLDVAQARLTRAKRERLPGIGVRLVAERQLAGFPAITSTVTLYDDLPWGDIGNRLGK